MRRRARAAVAALGAVLALIGGGTAHAAAGAYTNFDAAGEHTLVILPVFWTAPDAQTTQSLRALARRTGDYWSEQTSGGVTVADASITVYDWMRIQDPVICDRDAIFNAATTAANVHAGSYHKHVIVYFPEWSSCPWQGSGQVGDDNYLIHTYGFMWINGYTSADVWEREFGHTLGLGIARGANCRDANRDQVPLSNDCDTRDYLDYDLMGAARGHEGFTLNTALADAIGLLGPDAVRTASVGASFALSPVGSHTGLMAVKVPLSGSTLYIEYRPSVGRDALQPPGWSGVQVRQRIATSPFFSRVLALNPDGTDGLLANVAASVGVGWQIPGTYMTLVVDSQDAGGARIHFASLPDSTPPPVPAAPIAAGTATPSDTGIIGGDLYLSWPPMNDPDSGIASFQVYVDDALVRTVGGTAYYANLPTLPAGAHKVRVDATNNAGLTTVGTEAWFHSAPAPSAPGAPTVTAALAVDWTPVADADLTGYRVYVDENLVGVVGTDTTHYQVTSLTDGYHSARVVAVNATGLGTTGPTTGFWADASPPPAPAAPTVTAAASYRAVVRGALQVGWSAVQDPESDIASYRVFVDDAAVATNAAWDRSTSVAALPTGSHRIRVDAVNGAGLTATGATRTVRVDQAAPVLAAPTVALRPGSAAAGTPVVIVAPAVDADAGICSMVATVDGRAAGTSPRAPLRVNAVIPASGRATVRVTATDCVGNAVSATRTVTTATAAETAARYSRGWVTQRSRAYAGRVQKRSGRTGATATYTFIGSQVGWIGSRAATTGVATVYLDGRRVATVDTRGAGAHRQLIWATTTRYGRHTLKVVVRGTARRPTVALDGFITLR